MCCRRSVSATASCSNRVSTCASISVSVATAPDFISSLAKRIENLARSSTAPTAAPADGADHLHGIAAERLREYRRPLRADDQPTAFGRSEEHTSELQSLMRISYAVFCLKKNTDKPNKTNTD